MRRHRILFLPIIFVLLSGCATLCPTGAPIFRDRPETCQAFLEQLDEAVDRAGVRDASTSSVPCFPYLRSDRFLAALKKNLETDEERAYWLQWMLELNLSTRKKEVRNLPDDVVVSFNGNNAEESGRAGLLRRVRTCSKGLLRHDQTCPGFYETLYLFVTVPDEYSFWMRAGGLYPLEWLPVNLVTKNVRDRFKSWYARDLNDLPIEGDLRYFVPSETVTLERREIRKILGACRENPLGVPRPNDLQAEDLVVVFAPVFVQDVAGPYDCMGRVVWDGHRLDVDSEFPTVYYYLSWAFLKQEAVLQINYVIWFGARGGRSAPWMERGHLDGLTIRVSLDKQGQPFMVDVMNNCGCYHFFSPDKESVERVLSKPFALDPFVPQWLPAIPSEKRLGIRINSGWHQVERLIVVATPLEGTAYDLVPYHILEALPRKDGSTESMFDAKGIAKGSDRIEPFILFSCGIPSVGAMRQRGNHPIALTGREHFDDPYLFDRNFVFKQEE